MSTARASRIPVRAAGLSAALLLTASAFGCSGDPPVGSLKVPYIIGIGAADACATNGVSTIEMTLNPIGEDIEDLTSHSQTVSCEAGEVNFADVGVGTYEIVVAGKASDGVTVVDNLGPGKDVTAEVLEDQAITASEVVLGFTPATLGVYWELRKGNKQDMCPSSSFAQFEVRALTADQVTDLSDPVTFKCADATDDGGYHVVVDPGRKLDGSRFQTVYVQPRDATGAKLGEALIFCLTDPPGHGRRVDVDISCNEDTLSCESLLGDQYACALP